jgi:hypothetical protein
MRVSRTPNVALRAVGSRTNAPNHAPTCAPSVAQKAEKPAKNVGAWSVDARENQGAGANWDQPLGLRGTAGASVPASLSAVIGVTHDQWVSAVRRAISSDARGATPRTVTSLSRLFTPLVRAIELRGTAIASARMRKRRSFAAPSTGGDDTRTRRRPSRTPSKPSFVARGCMRSRSNRSAPRTAYQTAGELEVNEGG